MEAFKDLLRKDKITFVLFYAPWCSQSWIAAKEFNNTAEVLYREVSCLFRKYLFDYKPIPSISQDPKLLALRNCWILVKSKP